jgi:heterodisulfide reductase subunit C
MLKIDSIIELAGYKKSDLSVCVGCKTCASVCSVNDLGIDMNPQELIVKLFLGQEIGKDHALLNYCTNCYRCTSACPWKIRIPEVVKALRESLDMEGLFEKAFKRSVNLWGRVYEPFVLMMSVPIILKQGYLRYLPKWLEYASVHLPHKVKRLDHSKGLNGPHPSKGGS